VNRTEFKRSPAKNVGLLLTGIALVAASALAARVGEDQVIRAVGWFGVVFFALAVVKAIRNLFSDDIAYVFDERGIDDRLTGLGLIPWPAITNVEILSVHGTRLLLLSLDRPDVYLERVSAARRRLAAMNRKIGWGDWSLTFVGITPGVDEALKLVNESLRNGR
jgi:hypothetical protein